MAKKRFYLALCIVFIFAFSFTYVFAMENSTVVEGIRNVVGGAENTLENAGNGAINGIKNITSNGQNMMGNVTNAVGNDMQNTKNNVNNFAGSLDMNNSNYNATRTMATTNNSFLGMDTTMWTWIIMAVVGIAIIALVWIYAKQNDHSYND